MLILKQAEQGLTVSDDVRQLSIRTIRAAARRSRTRACRAKTCARAEASEGRKRATEKRVGALNLDKAFSQLVASKKWNCPRFHTEEII